MRAGKEAQGDWWPIATAANGCNGEESGGARTVPVRSSLTNSCAFEGSASKSHLTRCGRGYVFSARTALPLPVRNERGEGRGEGQSTADTPAHLQARRPSSPQPSPPSAGGEGEDPAALNTYGKLAPPGARHHRSKTDLQPAPPP